MKKIDSPFHYLSKSNSYLQSDKTGKLQVFCCWRCFAGADAATTATANLILLILILLLWLMLSLMLKIKKFGFYWCCYSPLEFWDGQFVVWISIDWLEFHLLLASFNLSLDIFSLLFITFLRPPLWLKLLLYRVWSASMYPLSSSNKIFFANKKKHSKKWDSVRKYHVRRLNAKISIFSWQGSGIMWFCNWFKWDVFYFLEGDTIL